MNDWQSARGDDWGSGYSVEGTSLRARFGALMRPMTVQEMIDDAIALYREGFGTMLRISFWCYLPFLGLSVLLLIPIIYLDLTTSPTLSSDFSMGYLVASCSSFLLLPGYVFAPGVQSAMVSLTAHRMIQGEDPTVREVWRQFKPQFWNLIANQLLAMLILGFLYGVLYVIMLFGMIAWIALIGVGAGAGGGTGMVILMMVGLIILVALMTVLAAAGIMWMTILPQVIVLEGADAITAFGRAWNLMKTQYKRAIGCCLAFWGISAVFFIAIYLLLFILIGILIGLASTYGNPDELITKWMGTGSQFFNVISYLSYIVIMPAMCLCTLMFYYDLRFRREGLDIQILREMSRR